jgi:uncharacterized protein (DUF1778 family)
MLNTCTYTVGMRKAKPITLTMKPKDRELLDALAKGLNMNRSEFVAWLVNATADYLEEPKVLPGVNKEIKRIRNERKA